MQCFPWVEWFSVFIEWRCIQIPWYFCLCCLHSTKLCFHTCFHILILLHQIWFWNHGNCNHLVHCHWHPFVPCWIHYSLHVNWTLHDYIIAAERHQDNQPIPCIPISWGSMVLTVSAESIQWGCFLTQLQEPGYPINLHAMAYLGEGSASVGWKQGLQVIQSGDSIFERLKTWR